MSPNQKEFLNALFGGLCLFGTIMLLYLLFWLWGF